MPQLEKLGSCLPQMVKVRCRHIRKERRRGLISIEDCVEFAIRRLEVYTHGSEKRVIQDARGDKIDGLEAANVLNRSKKEKIRRLGGDSSTWSVFEAD